MSDGTCPTVKVVSSEAPGGHIVINESDFDAKIHKLWVAAEKTAEEIAADAEKLARETAVQAEKLAAAEAAKLNPPAPLAPEQKPAGWGAAPPA